LDVDINVNSNDEFGELANSFREMITYFKEISRIVHAIGQGELDVEIKKRSQKDMLAESFIEMIKYFKNIAQIAHAIGEGDVDVKIEKRSQKDMLSESLKGMIDSLQESVKIAHSIGEGNLNVEVKQRSEKDGLGKALQNMVTNLKTVMSELSESTSVLNSAASEILTTTSQIASSAAQTSSAVSETTSSVEEIKQTAKLTSEKAVHTAESTKKAVFISDERNKSLDLNMLGLSQIKEKMDLIAANIIRLSEQSQMIGNIVSTVEDIASQSNLLAVNASIEAVKAGEHGKGFSVVAQELKNLANQSKNGTSEVQKILADIQKATNTLVMVAEQGGKAVDEGVSQAQNAKKSMESLRKSVSEAAQSGMLIAVSSEQEMAGMNQISSAMLGIKDATNQNVASIRQVESSAKNLSILSQKLKSLMEQFTFGK
jgi:methyl-accepting chemotaxis protein